ncbi:hypothetical protein HZS_5953 [Henneguya salminicola]|nr:hypothetical protein HZS_5953 [Henneguya salminicola]
MPVVVICGYPCSGKSTLAKKLEFYYTSIKSKRVVIISDNDSTITRDEFYNNSSLEITSRNTIKNMAIQSFSVYDIIIIDTMAYIKSFRYEIYCACKAQRQKHLILHVSTDIEKCIVMNSNKDSTRYSETTIRSIVDRFEYPNLNDRWDFPLLSVDIYSDIPFERIDLNLSKPPPKSNKSTKVSLKKADVVVNLCQVTQEIVNNILNNIDSAHSTKDNVICMDFKTESKIPPHEIHSLRRKFLKMSENVNFISEQHVTTSFLAYLSSNFN